MDIVEELIKITTVTSVSVFMYFLYNEEKEENRKLREELRLKNDEIHRTVEAKGCMVDEKDREIRDILEKKNSAELELVKIKNQLANLNLEYLRQTKNLSARQVYEHFENLHINLKRYSSLSRSQRWEKFLKSETQTARTLKTEMIEKTDIQMNIPELAVKLYEYLSKDIYAAIREGSSKVCLFKSDLGDEQVHLMQIICKLIPLPTDQIIVCDNLTHWETIKEM